MTEKLSKNQRGFGAIEAILILVIVILLCFTGWFVYKHNHKSSNQAVINAPAKSVTDSSSKSTTTAKQSANLYDGWKSYTTKYDKLTLKYPSNWQLVDKSNTDDTDVTPGQDAIQLISNDSLEVTIGTGATYFDGGNSSVKVISSTPISVLGHADYLVYASDTSIGGGAVVTTTNSLPSTSTFPLAKNINLSQSVKSNSAIQGMPAPFNLIGVNYSSSDPTANNQYPISKYQQDPNYKLAQEIIESLSY